MNVEYNAPKRQRHRKVKRYAELMGNHKKYRIKSRYDNKLDYRGEIIVALHNDSHEARTIHNGDRIAQLILIPYLANEYTVTETLDDTERGEGGFGSTGVA